MERAQARGLLRRVGLVALVLAMAAALSLAPAAAAPERAWAGKAYDVTAPKGEALVTAIGKAQSFVQWLRTADGQDAVEADNKVSGVSNGLALYAEWEKGDPGDLNLWWGDKFADGKATGHVASSWEDIEKALTRHYAGEIDLTDSEKYPGFAVGVTRSVSLSAINSKSGKNTYGTWSVGETHAEQEVNLVIMATGLNDLTADAKKAFLDETGKECVTGKAAFIIGPVDHLKETGYMNSTHTNEGSWASSARRAWCNSAYRAALPSGLQGMLKQVNVVTAKTYNGSTNQTSQDYCFLPAEKEVLGSAASNANSTESGALTQWSYYKTASNRRSSYSLWERSPAFKSKSNFCYVSESGTGGHDWAGDQGGLAPCACI